MASLRDLLWLAMAMPALAAPSTNGGHGHGTGTVKPIKRIHLGPRPFFLVDNMDEGPLKKKLQSCSEMEMKPSKWSISHRGGGTMQFPEHTYESIMAGVCLDLLSPDPHP